MSLAIFDLGGTLSRGETWRAIMQYERQTRTNLLPLYVYLGAHMPYYFLYSLRFLSKERAQRAWGRDMGWTLWRLPEAEAEKMFTWIAYEYLQPRLRPDVVALLQEHQAAGDETLLLSGVVAPVAAKMATLLGFSDYAGTAVEVQHGHYTGHYRAPLVMGPGKVTRLRTYLAEKGWSETILAEATAYADSYSDRFLLEMVGRPVVVYPDAALLNLAHERSWKILGDEG